MSRIIVSRLRGLPPWVVLTQLFIGLGWLRASAEKLINPQWWEGDTITQFLAGNVDSTLAWYEPFASSFVLSNLSLVGIVVVVGELIAGLSLVSGRFLGIGLLVGLFMNINFLAAGAVNPSAFYLVIQGALGLWLIEQRDQRASTFTYLRAVSIVLGGLGLGSLPYISTLHPAKVIDDPAIMLILTALLAFVAAATAHHQLSTRQAPAPWPPPKHQNLTGPDDWNSNTRPGSAVDRPNGPATAQQLLAPVPRAVRPASNYSDVVMSSGLVAYGGIAGCPPGQGDYILDELSRQRWASS